MANFNNAIRIDVTWTNLKGYSSTKNLAIQYDGSTSEYDIFCIDGNVAYVTIIFRGSVPDTIRYSQAQNDIDKTDFEANYKDIVTNRPTAPAAVIDGYSVSVSNPTLIAGSDGYFIRTVKTDSLGKLVIVGSGTAGTPSGGVTSIQGVSGGQSITIAGTVTSNIGTTGGLALDTTLAKLTVNQGTVLGSNTQVMVGGSVTTAVPTYTTGQISPFSLTTSGLLRVDASGVALTTTLASVSATGAAPPASANYIGGSVTTASPSYTTGQMNALSLTTLGALRTDGSAVTQPVSGTITANIGTSGSLALEATQVKLTIAQSTALGSNTQAMVGGSVTTAAPTYTTGNINPLSLTTAGALRTDSSGTTQTVSGTVAATQSGTWTVQPGNTANTTPWLTTINQGGNSAIVTAGGALKVDGSAVTQPISGAVTANIGTTNGLALDATLAKLTIAQGAVIGTNTQAMVGGSVTTTAPTYTTGQISPLSLSTTGSLRVDGSSVTQPISGTVTANQGGTWNINNISGTISLPTGAATEASLVKLTLAQGSATSGQSGTLHLGAVTTASPTYTTGQSNPLSLTTAGALRTDSSGTTQTVSGTVAATQSGTWTVQPGNTANTTPWLTTINQGGNSAIVTAGGALKVDGSAVTQPVSGTITANIGTTNGLALDVTLAKLTVAQGAAIGTNTQAMVGGSVTTAAPTYTTGQISPLSLSTAGALRTDSSATIQPVSGTVAATQSGTWTVQPGNTANTTPWLTTINQGGNSATVTGANALKVDGSAVTQPVSGTVTANIGTTNGLALDATLVKLTIAQGTALGANTQAMVGGSVTTAAPTYTTGQISPLSLTTAGFLRTDSSGTTQPVSGTVTANQGGSPWAHNVTQYGGVNISTGTGVGGAGIPRFTISSDSNILATQSGTWNINNISGTIGLPTGASTEASLAKLTLAQGSTTSGQSGPLMLGAVTTAAPTYTTGQSSPLSLDTSGALRITGSISATNPSVGATGAAPPASATYIGGSVTTAAPTYTTGQINALSLTTGGLLRVDGSAVTQPISGTITANIGTSGALALDATLAKLTVAQGAPLGANTQAMIGGSVTTAAPTYTTGQISPLSLSTAGSLRTDLSSWIGSTAPTVGSKTSVNSIPVVIASDQAAITVQGGKTNNNAAPGANNFGTLPSLANAANPTWTEGNQVSLSTNLSGALRVTQNAAGTLANWWGVRVTDGTNAMPTMDVVARTGFVRLNDGTNSSTVKAASTAAVAADTALVVSMAGANSATKIGDGTNNAAIKAASTAAVAADPALVVTMSPNNSIKTTAIIKPLYGTSGQVMTITLASLVNAASRASTAVDNTTNLYEDVYIAVKVTTAAAAVSATGFVNIYMYGTVDNGTTYPEAITGTDAAITLTSPTNLQLIGQINANTNSATKLFGPISLCRNAGFDKLPARWGIVIQNQTGATFNATAGNFSVTYQGINGQLL